MTFWTYGQDDATRFFNQYDNLMHNAGRYAGFDFLRISGMNIVLGHVHTGVSTLDTSNNTFSPLSGVWIAPNGSRITDATEHAFSVSPNISKFLRIDAIVGRYEYVVITGGAQPSYTLLEGVINAGKPTVLNPITDVILGYVYVPRYSNDLSSVWYEGAKIPQFARDASIAHIDRTQTFDEYQIFKGLYTQTGHATIDSNTIQLSGIGSNNPNRNNPNAAYFLLYGGNITASSDSNGYVEIHSIQGLFETNDLTRVITILAGHYLKFVEGGNVETAYKDTRIPSGTMFQMIQSGGKWHIVNNHSIESNAAQKVRRTISLSSQNVECDDNGALHQASTGNTLYIQRVNQNTKLVRWLNIKYLTLDSVEQGTQLTIINDTNTEITIETALSFPTQLVAPSGYKRFFHAFGDHIVLKKGGSITVVEKPNYWHITAKTGDLPYFRDLIDANFGKNTFIQRRGQAALHNGQIKLRGGLTNVVGAPNKAKNAGTNLFTLPNVIDSDGRKLFNLSVENNADLTRIAWKLQKNDNEVSMNLIDVPILVTPYPNGDMFFAVLHPELLGDNFHYELPLDGLILNAY